jgi:PadR family transcriptional regulator PadR
MKATYTAVQVARHLLKRPLDQHWGTELRSALALQAGTLYPILGKMQRAGWLTSQWETVTEAREDVALPGRAVRKYYMVTTEGPESGLVALQAMVDRWDSSRVAADA